MVIVVMGVTGAGKTTVGLRLARTLGWQFHDADDFHPPANKVKMNAGIPLTDDEARELAPPFGNVVFPEKEDSAHGKLNRRKRSDRRAAE